MRIRARVSGRVMIRGRVRPSARAYGRRVLRRAQEVSDQVSAGHPPVIADHPRPTEMGRVRVRG